ncbi:MAG: crossover junction endodeoxyribonuclease RuvC [Dehalococcoidia bacterium]|jgi:crossover junction endodeoxyribonuclease RuvC
MRIIGIDPGTLTLGYGIIDEASGEIKHVACGAFTAPSSMQLPDRLYKIYKELRKIIEKYQPDEAAIEEPFVAKNARSAIAVGQAIGAATIAVIESGIPLHHYTPTQVKQAVTSYGRSGKDQVAEMVCVILNLKAPPQPADAADALAVAMCHIQAQHVSSLLK